MTIDLIEEEVREELGEVLQSNISRRVEGLPAGSAFGSPLSSFVNCERDKQDVRDSQR
jgi:hypothetical protein